MAVVKFTAKYLNCVVIYGLRVSRMVLQYILVYFAAQWASGGVRCATVRAGDAWAAPLCARAGALWARPLCGGAAAPAPAALDWRCAPALVHRECRAPPDHVYRFCCVVVRERFPPDEGEPVAGHTLMLVPALRLENLLPLEMHYRCGAPRAPEPRARTAPPGDSVPFHQVTTTWVNTIR